MKSFSSCPYPATVSDYARRLQVNDEGAKNNDCFLYAFKFFMVTYLSFPLLCDFIKPYPRILLGLGGIQWACVLCLLYYSRDVGRWLRRPAIEGSPVGP